MFDVDTKCFQKDFKDYLVLLNQMFECVLITRVQIHALHLRVNLDEAR